MATATAKGASLNPADFQSGGAVPDGRCIIKAAQAVEFDYGGNAPAVPAVAIVFHAADGTDYEQNYSAGKLENLTPSADGTELVHPGGEQAKIGKSSNFAAFVAAMVGAGFPPTSLGSKVTCFVGADVEIVNQAQPKRPGLKDQTEGKTIPLPVKYYGQGKIGGIGAKTTARPIATPAPARKAMATAAPDQTNGAVDESAAERIMVALASAPDNTLGRLKLSTTVWLAAQKEKDPAALQYKKLAGDPEWLAANATGADGNERWVLDGDNVMGIPT